MFYTIYLTFCPICWAIFPKCIPKPGLNRQNLAILWWMRDFKCNSVWPNMICPEPPGPTCPTFWNPGHRCRVEIYFFLPSEGGGERVIGWGWGKGLEEVDDQLWVMDLFVPAIVPYLVMSALHCTALQINAR